MQALVIGTVWPEPNSTAAGTRMMQLIALLQKAGYSITFASAAQTSTFSAPLNKLNVKCISAVLNCDSFNNELIALKPDLVLYDRFMTEEQYGWRVTEHCPNAITILDTEDLHFLRHAREISYKQKKEVKTLDHNSTVFQREMASILRCDLTLIISTFEYNLLLEKYKINQSLLHYIPLMAEETITKDIPYEQRINFMSIGNFLHQPNWQTVLLLKKYWINIRKQIPNAQLHIYGSYVTQKAKALHNPKEGFLIMGRAENKKEVFENSRVMLAPIPYGAGVKGKLLEAKQFGTPSITTAMGFEGFGLNNTNEWNGFVTKDETDFIEKAIALYTQKETWEDAQNKGFKTLEKFKITNYDSDFIKTIEQLQKNVLTHRDKNYLGSILKHQSLQSSKYMSKWIMEKNKK